jgi:hypothetical protein
VRQGSVGAPARAFEPGHQKWHTLAVYAHLSLRMLHLRCVYSRSSPEDFRPLDHVLDWLSGIRRITKCLALITAEFLGRHKIWIILTSRVSIHTRQNL